MAQVLNQEWLTQNSLRNYPFQENVSLIPSEDPNLRLPNSFIVDCIMTVAGSAPRIYLASLMKVGNYINMTFKDENDALVSTVNIDLSSYVFGVATQLYGVADYSDMRGKIVLGNVAQFIQAFNDGNYAFTLTTAELTPSIIRPALHGIRQIIVVNNDIESEPITGTVKLVAGTNMKITYDAAENQIRFDATSIPGTNYNELCDCDDGLTPQCIKSINGISVDDVVIVGDGKCLEVTTSGNEIRLRDTCSEPCCGCEELEFLTSTLGLLEDNMAKLEAYKETLNSKLDQLILSAGLTL